MALVQVGDYLATDAFDQFDGHRCKLIRETPGQNGIAGSSLARMAKWRDFNLGAVQFALQ